MARSVLRVARSLMSRRKFTAAIERLEARSDIFEGDAEYYRLLGIAHLYLGDTGTAKFYFEQSRKLRFLNSELLLGQAALLLQRGDAGRAVPYYIDILENDPKNKVATAALEFIRVNNDTLETTIRRWVDTRKIERFYPPLGFNTDRVWAVVLPLVLGAAVALFATQAWPVLTAPGGVWGPVAEEATAVEARHYVLPDGEIRAARSASKKALAAGHYAEAMVEANRLMNSNALEIIKAEAREVSRACYPSPPMFETVGTVYSYETVAKDPLLYEGCYVVWDGMIMGQTVTGGVWHGSLSVSKNASSVVGVASVSFDTVPNIDMEREASVLGRISVKGGRIALERCKVHQSVRGKLETVN